MSLEESLKYGIFRGERTKHEQPQILRREEAPNEASQAELRRSDLGSGQDEQESISQPEAEEMALPEAEDLGGF
jgi:hypothetical protein